MYGPEKPASGWSDWLWVKTKAKLPEPEHAYAPLDDVMPGVSSAPLGSSSLPRPYAHKQDGRVMLPDAAASVDETAVKLFLRHPYDRFFLATPRYRAWSRNEWGGIDSLTYLLQCARRWRRNGAELRAELPDAFQAAAVGLWIADASRVDDPDSQEFESRAYGPLVRAEMQKFLRGLQPSDMGGKAYRRWRQFDKFEKKFRHDNEREPTDYEACTALGITDEQLADLRHFEVTRGWSSLDADVEQSGGGDDEENDTSLSAFISDSAYDAWGWQVLSSPLEAVVYKTEQERLAALLPILKPAEREMVLSDETDVTLAMERGVTKQAIHKVRTAATEKLRKAATRRGWVTPPPRRHLVDPCAVARWSQHFGYPRSRAAGTLRALWNIRCQYPSGTLFTSDAGHVGKHGGANELNPYRLQYGMSALPTNKELTRVGKGVPWMDLDMMTRLYTTH